MCPPLGSYGASTTLRPTLSPGGPRSAHEGVLRVAGVRHGRKSPCGCGGTTVWSGYVHGSRGGTGVVCTRVPSPPSGGTAYGSPCLGAQDLGPPRSDPVGRGHTRVVRHHFGGETDPSSGRRDDLRTGTRQSFIPLYSSVSGSPSGAGRIPRYRPSGLPSRNSDERVQDTSDGIVYPAGPVRTGQVPALDTHPYLPGRVPVGPRRLLDGRRGGAGSCPARGMDGRSLR